MDFLTVSLSMSIGCAVAWLIALYTPQGERLLFWNTAFGMLGAALCLAALVWTAPVFRVVGLVIAGPVCAWLAIVAGNTIRDAIDQAIRRRHSG